MEASIQQVVVLTFYILPGYVALYVADLVVPAPTRTPLQATVWSVLLSLTGALLTTLWMPPEYLAHLFGKATLSPTALVGTAAQTVSAVGVAGGYALLTKYALKNRLGQRSAYPTAWDALWSEHAGERRVVMVEAANGYYAGTLAYADDPRIGRAIVLREPAKWDEASRKYVRTESEFVYFPADQIRRIELSRATSPEKVEQSNGQVRERAETHRPTEVRDQGDSGAALSQGAPRSVHRSNGAGGGDESEQLRQSDTDRKPLSAIELAGAS